MWPLCIAFEQLFEIPLLMDFSCSEFTYLVRKDSFLLKSFEQAWLEMGQVAFFILNAGMRIMRVSAHLCGF